MTSSIDTNVLVARLDPRFDVQRVGKRLIEAAREEGPLVLAGCVFAELMAGPRRSVPEIETLLAEESIGVDWEIDEPVWRLAGERYRDHCARRRKKGAPDQGTRHILTDFLIGAHAAANGFALLTFDRRLFRAAFPELILRGPIDG